MAVERLEQEKLILWAGVLYIDIKLRLGVFVIDWLIDCNLRATLACSQSVGARILSGL